MQLYKLLCSVRTEVRNSLKKLEQMKRIANVHLMPLSKEINDTIDAILESNGNNVVAFRKHLSTIHYMRFIKADFNVSQWPLAEQHKFLTSLQPMI